MEEENIEETYLRFDTDILRYGEIRHRSLMGKRALLESGKEEESGIGAVREMPEVQVMYLNMLGSGIPWREACDKLGISRATPFLWLEELGEESIFGQCLELVKMIEADELESVVWEEAKNNKRATVLKMFALKARKDEYKDNAPPASNYETVINVQIGDQPYDISANYKAIEVDAEEIGDA